MNKFVFRFERLLEYRRRRRDLCRQLLTHILADKQRLTASQNGLKQSRLVQLSELRDLGQNNEIDVVRSSSRHIHAGQLAGQIELMEQHRRVLVHQVTLCRQSLAEADRDVQLMERLKDKRWAEHRYAAEQEAGRVLDETWLSSHAQDYAQ